MNLWLWPGVGEVGGECVGGRDRMGVWDWHIQTAIFKIDNQQGLYSTGKFAQYSVIT